MAVWLRKWFSTAQSVPIVRQATRTPYVRIGDSPLLVLFALTLAGLFLPFPRRSAA